MITAGNRKVQAPFDGKGIKNEAGEVIKDGKQEGLEYLATLAFKLGIVPPEGVKLESVYSADGQKETGQTIVTTRPIRESDIAEDLLSTAQQKYPTLKVASIGQTEQNGHNLRADTQTTSQEATEALIERIQNGAFAQKEKSDDGKIHIKILNVADQPFIPRMQIQVQDIVNQELAKHPELQQSYAVDVETIGKQCGVEALSVIKSDSAALARQQHLHMALGTTRERDTEQLLFSTKDVREFPVPPMPPLIVSRLQSGPARFIQ